MGGGRAARDPKVEALLRELTGPTNDELAVQVGDLYRRSVDQLHLTDDQWLALAEGLGVQIGQLWDWVSLARTGRRAPREVRRTTNQVARGRLEDSARVAANRKIPLHRYRR